MSSRATLANCSIEIQFEKTLEQELIIFFIRSQFAEQAPEQHCIIFQLKLIWNMSPRATLNKCSIAFQLEHELQRTV